MPLSVSHISAQITGWQPAPVVTLAMLVRTRGTVHRPAAAKLLCRQAQKRDREQASGEHGGNAAVVTEVHADVYNKQGATQTRHKRWCSSCLRQLCIVMS